MKLNYEYWKYIIHIKIFTIIILYLGYKFKLEIVFLFQNHGQLKYNISKVKACLRLFVYLFYNNKEKFWFIFEYLYNNVKNVNTN